ncbi:hypothetical protein TNCV_1353931 [Trichonephila clavipes]|nr:hypothetical protein TNCV_1353931 [Trichonephila clavipes]
MTRKVYTGWLPYSFRNCNPGQTRYQFLLEAGMSGTKETVLVLWTSSRDETILARFRSGHTRAQRHVAGLKAPSRSWRSVWALNSQTESTQANPAHSLACIG